MTTTTPVTPSSSSAWPSLATTSSVSCTRAAAARSWSATDCRAAGSHPVSSRRAGGRPPSSTAATSLLIRSNADSPGRWSATGVATEVSRPTRSPDTSTDSGSSNADEPSSASAARWACNAERARSSAVRPVTRAPRNSTPSGMADTWPSRFSSKSNRPSCSSTPTPTGVHPASMGAITAHASRSVGASSTSETVMPNLVRASARSRCGLISVVTAVPSSNATANSTGRGRDIRPSSPTVSIPIAQYRRAPAAPAEVRRNRATRRSVFRSFGSTGLFSTRPANDVHRLSAT